MEQTMKKQFEVTLEDTAKHQGSGDHFVLSTPRLVAYMENVAKQMIDGDSVGAKMEIRHTAPTPQGALFTVEAVLKETDGRRFTFEITAIDCIEVIATATHVRYLVDFGEFQKKADAKMMPL